MSKIVLNVPNIFRIFSAFLAKSGTSGLSDLPDFLSTSIRSIPDFLNRTTESASGDELLNTITSVARSSRGDDPLQNTTSSIGDANLETVFYELVARNRNLQAQVTQKDEQCQEMEAEMRRL